MNTVSKTQLQQAVDRLPPEMFREAWLFLEFLSSKASTFATEATLIAADPEGAFPELDISYESINEMLEDDNLNRLSRLLPE